MKKIFINIILILMVFLSSSSTKDDADTNDNLVILRQFDVSRHYILKKIMNEIITESEQSKNDSTGIYKLHIGVHKSLVMLNITKETRTLTTTNKFIGYFMIKKDTIVVTGENLLNLKYKRSNQKISIKLNEPKPVIYDPKHWLYHIKNYRYAKYDFEKGWIWSDDK